MAQITVRNEIMKCEKRLCSLDLCSNYEDFIETAELTRVHFEKKIMEMEALLFEADSSDEIIQLAYVFEEYLSALIGEIAERTRKAELSYAMGFDVILLLDLDDEQYEEFSQPLTDEYFDEYSEENGWIEDEEYEYEEDYDSGEDNIPPLTGYGEN